MSTNVAAAERPTCAIRPGQLCRPLSFGCSAHCAIVWEGISAGAREWMAQALEAGGDDYAATLARALPVREALPPLVIRRSAA